MGTRKKKRKVPVPAALQQRAQMMVRALAHYARHTHDPYLWAQVYCYTFTYAVASTQPPILEEFMCHTGNIAFACILFEYHKVTPITILSVNINVD